MANARTAQELAAELKQARHEYGKALAGCDSKPIRLARALDLGGAIDAAIDRLAALASQAEPSMAEAFAHTWADYWQQLASEDGRGAERSSRRMFVARLRNSGQRMWTAEAVLELLNDCDFLAAKEQS